MEWHPGAEAKERRKRWINHAGHDHRGVVVGVDEAGAALTAAPGPHLARLRAFFGGERRAGREGVKRVSETNPKARLITLDGSDGEGGGQILRTALSLSLLTGRPFRLVKIRANRDKPGLRPQHLTAVQAAAALGKAEIVGASVGSRDLTFRPGDYQAHDIGLDIGTAGATALVLQTLHLPLALRAESAARVTLTGGTFNTKAPSFPFLQHTWRAHLAAMGAATALAMPGAGFYPRGGGMLDAWIEPAALTPLRQTTRGPLLRIRGDAGVARLGVGIAERMRQRALNRIADAGLENVDLSIELVEWDASSPGAAIALRAEFDALNAPATFVGLGERGKPAEAVADEAVDELLAFLGVPDAAVDPHSADQILLPLALAEGPSEYTVSEVTEHLRTNARTIRAFLADRPIVVQEPRDDQPGRVFVG